MQVSVDPAGSVEKVSRAADYAFSTNSVAPREF